MLCLGLLTAPGCGTFDADFFSGLIGAILDGLDGVGGNNNQNFNGNNNQNDNDSARVLFFVHGQPINGIAELNVTIETLELLDDRGEALAIADLDEPVRVNLINSVYSELFACFDDAPVGTYARARLLVRNPELVLENSDVIPSDDITLSIPGVIELLPGATAVTIEANANNVIEFDLANRDDALLVTDNGGGAVTVDSEIFYSVFDELADPALVGSGIVLDIDAEAGSSEVFFLVSFSNCNLTVFTDDMTDFFDAGGAPIGPGDIEPDDVIGFEGAYDPVNDVMTATVVQVLG